ncbi:MAG: hypothetical protein MPW14_00040 [Candidatus Manganitrophus sp.]|nr:hypothetical protein [Candidatus Manganitrophus sp.]MDC4226485.1 hypothetical protein [Candidatus Manganitrophus sp.]WDT72324.1 MAG: hypothetical protein MPW17_05675 [Candidatus Manganitrophus sp.]WDT75434.1 MAG: hypothetical protein MPW16_19470 [Candidatus Manganitrophus sp.]WDT80239.1 MAG: hypothetical protein MPW14_00040 [Candidatus Manganitrophus sp.]
MSVREIKEGDLVLARYISAKDAWGQGLKFFSPDADYAQVGTWNYPAGKELLAHAHNEVKRDFLWTQEVLYIRKGRIRADIYDSSDIKVTEIFAEEGDVLVLLRGGHGYHILEDDTQVLEIKNGPYVGADLDRRRLKPIGQ